MVFGVAKRLLVGRPMQSERLGHTLLPKRIALPVFASDALSSVAYATEQILIVLSVGGIAFFSYTPWIALAVGVLMLVESLRTYVKRRRNPQAPRGKLHTHYLVHRLPLKLRFYKSKLYISALLPIGIGFVIGVLSAILGVGGGFVLVPAMIYLLGMPTAVVIGTSNFQILFVAANVTFLQAATNGTVDIVLALLLILGGVVGAPIGSRLAAKLPGVVLRGLMSILILAVATELLTELLRTPSSLYSLGTREVMP